jgi:hypothetical protein
MKRAASIAATTSSPIASVCCFQLPRHLFLPVGVEKDRESSIAQTIIVYECVHILVKVLREIRGLCMKRVEGWMKKKSMEDLEDLEDHRCHLPTVRSPTAERKPLGESPNGRTAVRLNERDTVLLSNCRALAHRFRGTSAQFGASQRPVISVRFSESESVLRPRASVRRRIRQTSALRVWWLLNGDLSRGYAARFS